MIPLSLSTDSRERFNDLQSKLQELDVLHQSSDEFFRTNTPSSRDSGVPVRSSSSCCSITSESASTPKSFLELPLDSSTAASPQTSVLHYFLHPPVDTRRHVSVHLSEQPIDMSYIHNSIPRYQSHGRSVHWDESAVVQPAEAVPHPRRASSHHAFQPDYEQNCYGSDSIIAKKFPQRISLNASLPFEAKLNIRIHADRTPQDPYLEENNGNQIKAIATVESLDCKRDQEHDEQARRNYQTHYSVASSQENTRPTAGRRSPIQQRQSRRDKLPRHRQVSLPVSLPIDQRLYLYIRNGEVLARC